MPQDLALTIDVGTGSVRAALVRHRDGGVEAFRNRTHQGFALHHGWSEQRPDDWWDGVVASVREVLAAVPDAPARVAAVAACGQMHGTVLMDEAGGLVRDAAPLWNDKRAQALVEAYKASHRAEEYLPATGNPPAAPWPAFKLQWFREHEPEVYRRTACVLMPKDWVNFRLTGVRGCDVTEASLSFLMDPVRRQWSPRMISELGLDGCVLAPIRECTELLGAVTAQAARATGLREGTPVLVGAADFPMALLGSGAARAGVGSDATGTGAILTLISDRPLLHPEVANTATPNGRWGAFVIVDAGGDAIRWARRAFHEDALGFEEMAARAASAPAGADGLLFLPFLTGERFAQKPNSRAALFGLTSRHGSTHLHRAVLEGVAFAQRRLISTMKAAGGRLDRLIASGGGAKVRLWLQIKAAMFRTPVVVPREAEGGVIGCAALVATFLGHHASPEAAADALVRFEEEIAPDPAWADRYDRMAPLFDRLYAAGQGFWDDLQALDA